MSFDWCEYLELARELNGDNSASAGQEAKQRSAVSRAYYSVLIEARHVVAGRLQQSPPRKNTHAWTINNLRNDPDPKGRAVSRKLRRLKKRRERSDYDDQVNNLSADVASAIREAELICQDLDQLRI